MTTSRPNVVVIMADDLGYSDLGCYGGEIRTPHLDRLAAGGVRLTRFHSSPRCSPSRASLLTGLHPHQTGIGILTNDDRPRGYPGTLNDRCVTMAEILRQAGYATCLAGKWHLTNDVHKPNDAWPTRRGFDRFFGTLTGCGSFYQPGTLMRGEENAEPEALDPDFFYTDAISTEAASFVREHRATQPDQPFFLYVAYTAPHWPLHAPADDVRRYDGVYDAGWDVVRERRLERIGELGLMDRDVLARAGARDPEVPPWGEVDATAWQVRRMQVYAAQVSRMDAGIGQVVAALRETGYLDDTLLIFLSDNGASAEELPKGDPERFRQRTDILRHYTRDGRPVRIGNDPSVMPGPEDTYASYGRGWANVSNTPFRLYKEWTHEGGIAAPFIVWWPGGELAGGRAGADGGRLVDTPYQLVDVLPTVLEAVGVDYPDAYPGRNLLPLEGHSMLAELRGSRAGRATPLFWEHIGNAAIQRGQWKLVRQHRRPWELYDIETDPGESRDLAAEHPSVVAELAAEWERWADRVGVIPFEETVAFYRERGLTALDAAG